MAQVRSWDDGKVGKVDLDDSGLGDKVKTRLLAQVVRMYEANARQGTHSTKTRGEMNYTGRKPYKQKGTGNARRGDRASPLIKGGGITFGPQPRDHGFSMPRKSLREALRSVLVGKLRDNEVTVMKSGAFTEPCTPKAAGALRDLECEGSTLVVVPSENVALLKSMRNLPRTAVVRASDVNALNLLRHRNTVFADDAWDVLKSRLAGTAAGAEA